MSVKKKTVLLALMLAGVMGLSGCKTWDVVCDILAVGTTKVEKDDGPKVDLEGETPEVKDDDSTDLETADSKTTSGNDEKEKDTKKNTTKGSDRTDKKRVTMPSGTSEPSHTTTPTPTPTPSGIEKKEKSGHMITCTSPVNVRDAASSQSRVIGELAKGDQVEKLGEDGGWVKIRYQGQEAWVYEDYMSEKNSRKEETKTEKSKQTDHSADKKSETYSFESDEKVQTD
ncbi:SH3 domain-containing protein [Blautia sp. AF19-34]|nr:SH3 domain-containing protein [Blautia sp. AF19-34]